MKIRITEDTKRAFYMSEMPSLKIAEDNLKECGGISKEDIQMFGNFLCGYSEAEILKSEAHFCKNSKVFDRYGVGSEHTDVWVEITVFDRYGRGFYIAGAYLSDIWEIGGVDKEELKNRMFIREFKESK